MDRELFKAILNQIKRDREKTDTLCNALESMCSDGGCYTFIFEDDESTFFKILECFYNKSIVENMIGYFTCDLEFGEKWEPGSVTEDGKDIKLQTIDDLYEACERDLALSKTDDPNSIMGN